MKGKRLVSFVATTAMLMSMTAPALAVTADALGRLSGLGVITGYSAGGTDFKPEQTITRAEFAAVAVRLLGLEGAASAAKGATKFKDVASSHWASGYINLAVGNGVIKGYPDGTFKPEGKVTYAESFAMLVRVLGYEPQVTGQWPTNYVGKASQIGLLDGLTTADFNASALRGNIFTAADNALDIDIMEQTVFGADPEWSVTNKSLLEAKLDYVKVKDVTIDQVPITNSALDANEVHITATGFTGNYEVVGNLNVNDSIGLTGTAWLNATDDKIILFQSDDKIEADQIKSISTANDTVTLKVLDDTYAVTTDTKFYVNFNQVTDAEAATIDLKLAAIRAGEMVNVVRDNDTIKAIYAFDLNTDIVDRVDAANDKIYVTEGGGTIELADNYAIVKDGKTIGLSDVKEGDVIQWNKEAGDKYYVRVATGTATGKLSNAVTTTTYGTDETYKVTIGGTQYTTAIGAQYSTDNGDSYDVVADITDLGDVDGKDVTAYLDSFGKVAFIKSGDANVSNANTVLVKEFTYSTGADGNNYYVRVMKADGTETYYKVDKDTTLNNDDLEDAATATTVNAKNQYSFSKDTTIGVDAGKELQPGTLVKVDLSSDGTTVDNFETFAGTEMTVGTPGQASLSDDNNTISVAGKTVQVQADTKFFTVDEYDADQGGTPAIKDGKYITWADVKSTYAETNFGGYAVTIVYDGAKAQYVFINANAAVTSDTLVGVVDSKGVSGSDKILNVFLPSGMKSVEYGWTTEDTGKLYTFELDSDNKATNLALATSQEVYVASGFKTYEVRDITDGLDNSKIITLRTWDDATSTVGTYDVEIIVKDSITSYIDITNDPVKVDGVAKGDHITVYDLLDKDGKYTAFPAGHADYNDGIADFIVIEN